MDHVAESFAIYRFILSLALIAGGICAIWFGYRLFLSGAGTAKALDKLDLKSAEVKLSAAGMSVGAVLMLTSCVWSYFAYSSFPKIKVAGDTLTIGQLVLPTGTVESAQVGLSRIVGAPVYTSGNEKVGKISQVVVNNKAQATGIVVQTDKKAGSKQFVLTPEVFHFDKSGSTFKAVVKMNKQQLNSLPSDFKMRSE